MVEGRWMARDYEEARDTIRLTGSGNLQEQQIKVFQDFLRKISN